MVVSHDRHLLRMTTDQLLLVAHGRVKNFEGDLGDYRQWLLEHRAEQPAEPMMSHLGKLNGLKNNEKNHADKVDKKEKKRLEAAQREQRRPLQNRLKQVEKELDKLTVEKAAVEASLAEPATYEDKEKLQQYIHQQAQLAEQLQRTEEKWLEITEALEELANC